MDLLRFEIFLKQKIGLDAASIGSSAVERTIQSRMSACKLPDLNTYWEHLNTSDTELQELVDSVVVNETWFFRDEDAYAALVRIAHDDWLKHHPAGSMRLLSLPCATGEEPYSMAMALLDSQFPASRFRIEAIDISARAIALAKAAVYRKNSFRGDRLEFRDRHFTAVRSDYRLAEAARAQVDFSMGNMLDGAFRTKGGRYDVVFCRNVLIYFDGPTQDRAIQVLGELLSDDGILFVGHSEAALLMARGFASARIPHAFVFRKAASLPEKIARAPRNEIVAPTLPARAPRPSAPTPPRSSIYGASAPSRENGLTLDHAQSLADQGHLAEAARQCEGYLRHHGPSPEAFYLLGVVRDASGNHPEAADFYRKALYLDPYHREAILHLALLLKSTGDTAGGCRLEARAARIPLRKEP